MRKVCDKALICVDPCSGLSLNEEYRTLAEDGHRVMVYNSNGDYKYYRVTGLWLRRECCDIRSVLCGWDRSGIVYCKYDTGARGQE